MAAELPWRIYGAYAEHQGVSPTVAKRPDQPLCVAGLHHKSHFFGCKSAGVRLRRFKSVPAHLDVFTFGVVLFSHLGVTVSGSSRCGGWRW